MKERGLFFLSVDVLMNSAELFSVAEVVVSGDVLSRSGAELDGVCLHDSSQTFFFFQNSLVHSLVHPSTCPSVHLSVRPIFSSILWRHRARAAWVLTIASITQSCQTLEAECRPSPSCLPAHPFTILKIPQCLWYYSVIPRSARNFWPIASPFPWGWD